MSAIKKIEAGKYHGKGNFSHWIKKVFRRFADTELNKLTQEKNRFVGLMAPDDEEEDRPVAPGYVSSEITALEQKRRDDLEHDLRSKIDAQVEWLPEADQAYAEFLKAGMNQKQAAAAAGVSVVTARKYERRIRRALSGLVNLEGCADESNVLPWSEQGESGGDLWGCDDSSENSFSIWACADEPSAKFLTAEEAAAYLGGLNSRTVTRWAREGYLPAIPIGEGKRRLWRFLRTDLESWMLSRRQGGQNAA